MLKGNALKRTSKNRWMIWVIVVALALGGTGYYYYTRSQSADNNETALETSTVGTGDIILSATGLGTLIPSEEVSFGFTNSGEVSEVLVSLGDKVEVGQVLAQLENNILELKYKQAEANLAALASPADIAEAEQAMQEAKESFATARNDLQYLIGSDVLVAEEKVADAQDALDVATTDVKKDASDENKQKVTNAEAALAKTQEILASANFNYASNYTIDTFTYPIRNDKGTTIRMELIAPTDAEVLSARATYQLAKANLEDTQNYLDVLKGNVTTDEVPASSVASITETRIALEQAKADLEATKLIAPINGIITSLNLNVGQDAGTSAVITISNLGQPYVVDAYLDETDWDKARVGFAATVTFDLLPDNSYSGKVIRVYPILDDTSGTSMVHILVQLDEHIAVELPAGATASVDIVGGEALDVVLVPTSALKQIDNGTYIVYLMKNGTPVEQKVESGLQDILYAEVKSGLQVGDVVLTNAVDGN
jgi:RND family efflux transporter MFP subunit